ncbi:hypothetical protein RN001_011188 [Aquatica leii]|uniref:DEP domain-containing protein n=1 Tax=Aquatica leii TaxID=1421715 RepID=A0AAN7P7K6_9COLE|nr:hypothetical protein RN001_011188 [Aquatica leii]
MLHSSAAIENLYPALAQCFAIITCGYFAGRVNLLSETEAKGINTFIGTFSLPSLIFMSLAKLDLSSVNWMFLLSILIAKSVVFFAVIIITLLVGRPVKLGRAGIFAIFCTQSNDFAIGYPIVAALYKDSHPEYASYLYLMAPISLAILNPIGFVLMEFGKQRNNESLLSLNDATSVEDSNKTKCKMFLSVTKSIFLNPVIAMTILGICGNFIFKHEVPSLLAGILDVLSSAFSASALFLLGLRMVGKVHTLRGATLVLPGILIIVKLLVLPLVIREVVSLVHVGSDSTENSDWSTYGFFYGTFPAAPTVFFFATQYNLDVDLIASTMVACTFISAPLMFVSAKMITLTNTDPADYISKLDGFTFDVSIGGLVACVWVIFVFVITKRITRIPHRITTYLILSQLLSCLGAILWNVLNQKEGWFGYLQFAIFTTGVYSSRIWTSFLGIVLLLLQSRSLCYVLKLQPLFIFIGWGLPIILSVLFLLLDKEHSVAYDKRNPNFIYGASQAVVAVSLLFSCFIMTVGCLILHQRYNRRHLRYLDLANDVGTIFEGASETTPPCNSTQDGVCGSGCGNNNNRGKPCNLPTINEGCCEDTSENQVVDIEDLLNSPLVGATTSNLCPSQYGCQGPQREQCRDLVDQYQQQTTDDLELIEEEPESHDPQIFKHVVLLILLLCSMFVGLSLSIWTLVMEKMSGIYIELSFLDASLNFGQSIIVFAIFGTNTKEIALPILHFWKKLWFGANKLNLPAWHELSTETKYICDQFVTHHVSKCRQEIAKDKRWRIKVYKNVFSGRKFVDWLIEVGLARDRTEAVNYARHLIEGRVLKHINGVYHFHDRNLLYKFNSV